MCSSTIVADVLEHCEPSEATDQVLGCAYFYFDGRDSQTDFQLFDKFILSLVSQLVSQHPTVPNSLIDLEVTGREPDLASLKKVLLELIGGFDHVYIVIDALDECKGRRKLMEWISHVSKSSKDRLHLLATSRPEPDIEDVMRSLATPIAIVGNDISVDMGKYIDEKFQEAKWTKNVEEVKEILLTGSGGVYGCFATLTFCTSSLIITLQIPTARLPNERAAGLRLYSRCQKNASNTPNNLS